MNNQSKLIFLSISTLLFVTYQALAGQGIEAPNTEIFSKYCQDSKVISEPEMHFVFTKPKLPPGIPLDTAIEFQKKTREVATSMLLDGKIWISNWSLDDDSKPLYFNEEHKKANSKNDILALLKGYTIITPSSNLIEMYAQYVLNESKDKNSLTISDVIIYLNEKNLLNSILTAFGYEDNQPAIEKFNQEYEKQFEQIRSEFNSSVKNLEAKSKTDENELLNKNIEKLDNIANAKIKTLKAKQIIETPYRFSPSKLINSHIELWTFYASLFSSTSETPDEINSDKIKFQTNLKMELFCKFGKPLKSLLTQ